MAHKVSVVLRTPNGQFLSDLYIDVHGSRAYETGDLSEFRLSGFNGYGQFSYHDNSSTSSAAQAMRRAFDLVRRNGGAGCVTDITVERL